MINQLRELKVSIPLIIFVTAFDSYAIKAFDVHALDYVLKPIDDARLANAIQKVEETLTIKNGDHTNEKLVKIVADFTGDDCEDILRNF